MNRGWVNIHEQTEFHHMKNYPILPQMRTRYSFISCLAAVAGIGHAGLGNRLLRWNWTIHIFLRYISITIIMAEFYMLLWASIFGVNCYSRQSMIQVYLRSNDFCLRNSSSWDVPGAFKRKQPVCNNISLPFTEATFRGLTFLFKKLISLCERASQIFPYLRRCSQVIGSLSQTLGAMQ